MSTKRRSAYALAPGGFTEFMRANHAALVTWPAWKRSADCLARPRDPWRAERRALAEALFGWLGAWDALGEER